MQLAKCPDDGAASASEMLINYKTTWRYDPEDGRLQTKRECFENRVTSSLGAKFLFIFVFTLKNK
jgi:hypothetical protein